MTDDKKIIKITRQGAAPRSVCFSVTVDEWRADYLKQCLEVPLCQGCGREEDECSADPCQSVMKDRGDPQCDVCRRYVMKGYLNVAIGSQTCCDCVDVRKASILEAFHQQWQDGHPNADLIDLNQNYEIAAADKSGGYVAVWLWVSLPAKKTDS
ncbi:MAG: hypothetical protein GY815_07275 [Gammaproteobacteria bacterium]|nr:hypothetical protein [Gammaproteobacteria bacterium]